MNLVILMGRVTADVELQYSKDKKPFVRFTIAVNRQNATDFVSCIAYDRNAEWLGGNVRKGDRLLVRGSWRSGSYDKNGVKIYTNECPIDRFYYIEPRRHGEPSDAAEPETVAKAVSSAFDDLPF